MQLYTIVVGPISTNCYIVADDGGNAAVVDPGASAERIFRLLAQKGLTPRLILLTHGHFDHTGAVMGLKKAFPGLQAAIGKNDAPILAAACDPDRMPFYAKADDYAGLSAEILVGEGDVLEAGSLRFAVLDTPGHTRGGVCYLCEDLMLSGDTLFYHEVGRTDLDGGNYPTLMRSIKKLAQLPQNYTVLPGHEASSTLFEERENNPYMQEALTCF